MSVAKPVPLPGALSRVWADYVDAAHRAGLAVERWTLERHRDGSIHVAVATGHPRETTSPRSGRRARVLRSRIAPGTVSAIEALRRQTAALDAVNRVDV